jgi:hypothetical protein
MSNIQMVMLGACKKQVSGGTVEQYVWNGVQVKCIIRVTVLRKVRILHK